MDSSCGWCFDSDCRGNPSYTSPRCPEHGKKKHKKKKEEKQIKVTFADFMHEIEAEAKKEGPVAVKELNTFKAYFSRLNKRWEEKRSK